MRDDDWKQLLQQADAGAAVPRTMPGDLAERVRRLDRRRRTARGLAALAGGIVAAAVGWQSLGERSEPIDQVALADEAFRAEIAELDQRIAAQQRLVDTLWLQWRGEQASSTAGVPDAAEEIETVAGRMVEQADRLREAMQPSAEAQALYERVVTLFPQTYFAEIARQRLSELTAPGES